MTTRAKATYEVRVDLDGNRQFTDASGDITSYVEELKIEYGMQERGDRIGQSAEMEMTLDNYSGLFSPERSATRLTGFTKGRAVRVRMTYNATTSQLYVGRIDSLKVDTGDKGKRKARVKCRGFLFALKEEEARVATQEGKTYDEIIEAVLGGLRIYPPATNAWFIGIAGFSELGVTSILGGGVSDYAVLESGINTFNYAGDTWHEGIDVRGALRDVILTEAGWIWEDYDGKLHGWNRHHMHQDMVNAVDATVSDADASQMDYEYGGVLLNDIEITFSPRKVSAISSDTLGKVDSKLKLRRGFPTITTVRFDDGSGNRISGLDVITPVAHTDYKVNTRSDGLGDDVTGSVTCTMVAYADKAELTFVNNTNSGAWLMDSARVRGKKLSNFGQQMVMARDETSIHSYGRYSRKMTLSMLDDEEYARNLAEWIVAIYKEPTGTIKRLRFNANSSATLMGHARDRRIGDRIAVSEAQTGLTSEYFIMGMTHDIRPRSHMVEWRLDSAPAQMFWLLGVTDYGELGVNTYLGL